MQSAATLRFLEGRSGSAPGGSGKAGPSRTKAQPGRSGTKTGGRPGTGRGAVVGLTGTYPGDFRGTAKISYAPSPNGRPEPGEVVWTWDPYEEDHSRGKDRPVLLVGTSGRYLLGLMLTSKDHDGDARREDDYVDIGTGPWKTGNGAPAKRNWTASCRSTRGTSGARAPTSTPAASAPSPPS